MTATTISLPRQLGNPTRLPRLARTPEDVERFLAENNGKHPCFASVYRFRPEAPDSLEGGPERWAVFDRVFLDFDAPGRMGLALEECCRVALALKSRYGLTYRAAFSGSKGFHLYPLWQPHPVRPESFRPLVREIIQRLGENLHLGRLDPAPKDGAARLCRVPNTINTKSRLYCVPILPSEIEDPAFTVDDALVLARGSRSLSPEEITVPLADFSARLASIEREMEAAREREQKRLASLPPPKPRAGGWLAHPRIAPILRGLPEGRRYVGASILARAARLDGMEEEAVLGVLRDYWSQCENHGEPFDPSKVRDSLRFARDGKAIPWAWVKDLETTRALRREGLSR